MKRKKKNSGLKKVFYIYGGILLILFATCIIVYNVYNKKLEEATKQSLLATQKMENIVPNNVLEDASAEISKSIEEALAESKANEAEQPVQDIPEQTNIQVDNTEEPVQEEVTPEPVKPLEFMYPVQGEIIKEFASEKLVFSETLQEWITHNGVDIKAERTAVVKAAEDGTVTGIKNDPRYGLTVIIEHRDGYKTIYSNLLTTEFVAEGDIVAKGQSLGTVGNSAIFEIADEPHLHFELLQNEEYLDPSMFLK